MLEDVTLERQFGPEVGRFFHGVLEEHGVEIARRRRAGALRGRRRPRPARWSPRAGGRARLRLRGRRRRRDARRDAGPLGRARAGRDRRRALLGRPRELGAGDLRGGRHLRVREPAARPPAADRALGRGRQPRQDGRAQHARARRGARRDPVLLLRPRRLGLARVRGPGRRASAVVRGSLDDGEFTAFYLATTGASRRRWRWAARTTSSTPAASSPTVRAREPRALADLDTDLAALGSRPAADT